MMPALGNSVAPVPPPAYHRTQARLGPALHIDAPTLINTLHLLLLCRLTVRLAHHRCPPPLPAGPGGAPRTYREESLLLIALLRTLWRLSYLDMHDWLRDWPALAMACGLPRGRDGCPRIPSPSQQCKRGQQGGAPLPEALFVLSVLTAIRRRLVGARDLIIDSAPILAWHRADSDAAYGHAPAQHSRPLLRGYRVHTLICRGSGLPLFFLLSPANSHDAPFAQPLLAWAVHLYQIRPRFIRLDAAYWGGKAHRLDSCHFGRGSGDSLEPQTPEKSLLFASYLDQRGVEQTQWYRTLLWSCLPFLSSAATSPRRLVYHRSASGSDLHSHDRRCFSCTTGRSS